MRTRVAGLVAITLCMLFAAPETAAAQGQTLAFAYTVTVAGPNQPAFEAAWKEHLAFREAQGDPWTWNVFQTVFGENPDQYVVYSGNHSWADLDSYNAMPSAQTMGNHLAATVAPTAEGVSSAISAVDADLSVPAENLDDMNVFPVTIFYLEASEQQSFMASLAKLRETVMATGLDLRYHVAHPIAGQEGPSVTVVQHAASFSALEADEAAINAQFVQHLGAAGAQELMAQLQGAVERTESSIVVRRRDLSSGN